MHPQLRVAAPLTDLVEARIAQCDPHTRLETTGNRGRSDPDRREDRKLDTLRKRLVLEVELERLPQVGQRLLNRFALACHLDLEAPAYIPGRLVDDRRRQSHYEE